MENAGAGAARVAMERWNLVHSGAICVCGPGMNGGDGLVVARHLAVAGVPVRVLLAGADPGAPRPRDVDVNLAACRALGIGVDVVGYGRRPAEFGERLRSAGLVVDALFGIGLSRPLEGAPADLVVAIGSAARAVLALDVPSGFDCDSGRPLGTCIRADATATFGATKVGFLAPGARAWTGDVVVVPIGAPTQLSARE